MLTKAEVIQRIAKLPVKYTLISTYTQVKDHHLIQCPCGYTWSAVLAEIFRGKRCPKCSKCLKLTEAEVDARLSDRPIYRLGKIKNTGTKTTWGCTICGNIWSTTPNSILNGRGCSLCAAYGFSSAKVGYLYVIKISTSEEEFIKVGITNREPLHRYKEILRSIPMSTIEEICTIEDSGYIIKELEALVHTTIPKYTSIYKFNGYTELFNSKYVHNILEVLANGCQHK